MDLPVAGELRDFTSGALRTLGSCLARVCAAGRAGVRSLRHRCVAHVTGCPDCLTAATADVSGTGRARAPPRLSLRTTATTSRVLAHTMLTLNVVDLDEAELLVLAVELGHPSS